MYIQLFVLRVKSPPTLKEEKMISGDNWDIQKQPPGVFYNKGVLRNFIKFTGKHLCQSLILIKLQAEAYNFIKKETLGNCFPVNFVKFIRTPLYRTHPDDSFWIFIKDLYKTTSKDRSSRPQVFCKTVVPPEESKMFSSKFCEFFKETIFIEHLRASASIFLTVI